jgi:SAM-dependent methyltransferase
MRILAGIFLCSFTAISFEIALTRIFSISLWYHFAFMIVSIAMLGIGVSGTVLSLYPKLKNSKNLGIYALLLSLSVSLNYTIANFIPFDPVRLSWDKIQILYIGVYYIVLCIPFFFFGLIVSASFVEFSEKSGSIYGADLLGAGTGSIAVILLMSFLSPGQTVFAVASSAALGALIMGRKKAAAILIILNISILLLNPDFIRIRMSPYKGLQLALKYPGAKHIKTYYSGFSRVDVFESPMVRFAPGLSLKYLDPLPKQIGLSVDGSDINAITEGTAEFLRYLPSALAYEIKKPKDVLIVEPKGGLPVLVARQYGAENIYNVESNPLIVDVIKNDFKEFSGFIYNKNTWKGLARSWLKGRETTFDIIDISLMGAVPSGLFGISEDYRFTVEAFKEYFSHLKPDGILSVSLFILPPPRTEFRLLNTVLHTMEETGIKNTHNHIAAIRSWGSICMLFKNSAFSQEEINTIKDFSAKRNFDLIYYPGIKENETNIYIKTPSPHYYDAFKRIITKDSFRKDYIFNIKEVHDDSPFFHYYLKLKNLKEIYRLTGRKWQYFIEEGYLLPIVFIQVIILSLILLILPVAAKRRKRNFSVFSLTYFAFLGTGFMFIEVPLIQKMILPLENPSYAVATVLASVLISSGLGSLLSQRFSHLRSFYMVALLSIAVIPYGFLLSYFIEGISAHSMPVKTMFSFIAIMPAGLLMGIPFPLGMRILGQKNPSFIPWAWAVNGCFSVLAPILAVMLAMAVGFKWVFMLGALMYALAFVVLKKSISAPRLS